MIWMYVISVIVAYIFAAEIWEIWGDDIKKWERKLDKYMIYILLSSILIGPLSFVVLLICTIALLVRHFFVNVYKMIKYIFNL